MGRIQRLLVDRLLMSVKGGNGGHGLAKHGGIGGIGASVKLIAKDDVTLSSLEHKNPLMVFKGKHGDDSRKFCLKGKSAEPLVVHVPTGVRIVDETGRLFGELNKPDEELTLVEGGMGGTPLNNFIGWKSKVKKFTLDYRLVADVALLGFPNAGKSSLMRAISGAPAKIGSYPFTTVKPNIACISYEDGRRIEMADLPGLVEGAHENVGMGHTFLKHVERTKAILWVVDLDGFQMGYHAPSRTAFENIALLNRELNLYDPFLLRPPPNSDFFSRPHILILNKVDLPGNAENAKKVETLLTYYEESIDKLNSIPKNGLENLVSFNSVHVISCLNRRGIADLKEAIRNVIDRADDKLRKVSRKISKSPIVPEFAPYDFISNEPTKKEGEDEY